MNKLVSVFLMAALFCQYSIADRAGFGLINNRSEGTNLSEYFYKNSPNDLLVPVRLIGEVEKPGLYHVPANTSMLTLFSISGGPVNTAKTKEITIQRGADRRAEIFDLKTLLAEGKDVQVKDGDIIYVPVRSDAVSPNTIQLVTVVAGILGIVLSGILITRELQR